VKNNGMCGVDIGMVGCNKKVVGNGKLSSIKIAVPHKVVKKYDIFFLQIGHIAGLNGSLSDDT
jgi:hypothetical protein